MKKHLLALAALAVLGTGFARTLPFPPLPTCPSFSAVETNLKCTFPIR